MDPIRLSLQRPVFITMVTCFLVAVGVIALNRLSVDLYPEVSYPALVVQARLEGAAPQEMEQLVTKRMEDALSTIAGVEKIRSVSREGSSIVNLEFGIGTDVRFQEIQVRAKVANIRRSLPEELSEPTVSRQDPDDTPIIEIAVTGDRSAAELTEIADDIIGARLRQLSGVGQVDLEGQRNPEIKVELRPEALDAFGITAADIVQSIRKFNRNDPVGRIEGKDRTWVLRSLAEATTVTALGAISVGRGQDGQPVFLRDVGTIEAGFEEISRVSTIGDATTRRPAVVLNVLKQSGENSVKVSDNVTKALTTLKDAVPADVRLVVIRDNADLIRSNVHDVYESLIIGGLLTVLVVLIFLRSPRSTLTTGLALPTSVIATFAAMAVAGFTINVMTLLALSLAIGLLVDDAIVVRENIFRRMQMPGVKAVDAAYEGTREVVLAVLATTMTIVAVFLPVGFMGGVTGQFFKQFAITVVFAVLVSTWDAFTMAPMLSAYYANFSSTEEEWKRWGKVGMWINDALMAFEHAFDRLANSYKYVLGWFLPRPWAATLVALLSVASAVAGFMLVKKSFLPSQLGETFSISVDGPLAVPIERVREASGEVQARLAKVGSLEMWTMRYGLGWSGKAQINITARVKKEHAKNQETLSKVRQEARQAFQGLIGYSARVSEPADPLAGTSGRFQPLAVLIAGEDIDVIRDVARDVQALMTGIPGVIDVAPVDDQGLPEVRFYVESELAALYGTDAETIGSTLATWVTGDTSNSMRVGDDQIPIRVRLAGGDRLAPAELLARNLVVRGSGTRSDVVVPLGNVVRERPAAGPPVIVRENRQRVMRVGGNLARGAALADIAQTLNTGLKGMALPAGVTTQITGQSEQMGELFSSVMWALLIGSVFVYMVLGALFESFLQPLSVMAAIPLAGIGALGALILFDTPLDLYAGIGMILLAGIVAKNSILLIDFALQRVRDHNANAREAIADAAPLRLRPILMTSIAMIAGMIPVATGLGSGGEARRALGIATIGGVLSSTFLTLFVVPNLFVGIEALSRFLRRFRRRTSV